MIKKTTQNEFRIGSHLISESSKAFIIAEAGINHNGKLALAKKLVDAAVTAGADAVKFQMRHLSGLYVKSARENIHGEDIGTQYLLTLIKEADLPPPAFTALTRYARSKGIMFLCTPWDKKSADYLEKLKVPAFKVASGDMTNFELLEHLAKKKKPLIISTGMASVEEIRKTTAFLKKLGATFAMLHCNSTYPAHPQDLNLRFISLLKRITGGIVGYSGHELGISTTVATIPLGAKIIERHITLDHTMRGPDHAASLEPEEFKQLVEDIRRVEEALGTEKRIITSGEYINRKNLGKSLVAAGAIAKGQKITRALVTAKSPAKGIPAHHLYDIIGKKASRDMREDDYFTEEDLGKKTVAKKRFPKKGWGIIARPHDIEELSIGLNPKLIELHFSSRDLEHDFILPSFPDTELIVHLPELYGTELLDLCASDPKRRKRAVAHVNRGLDLVRKIRANFGKTPPNVKTVVHVGGMTQSGFVTTKERKKMYLDLAHTLKGLNLIGIELLLENLPPLPWYKGGQWHSNTFTDADEMADFSKKHGYGLCYDSSHAQLYCNYTHKDPVRFFKTLRPYVRHIHLSDAAGLNGEGLQIGEGNVPWQALLREIKKTNISFTPEIWMGHQNHGDGFWIALNRLRKLGM